MRAESVLCRDEDETRQLGRRWAEGLEAGDVLLLKGALGAGKTCLTKGLAQGLGLAPDDVASPTFTLIREHQGGRLPLNHMDFYRLESPAEAEKLGLEEYFDGAGVCVIEWPERLGALAPPGAWRVAIEVLPDGSRRIEAGRG
jgi:tRNA threonylcarbamoyladenosine biosynthesis protein TsaE